VTDRSTTRLLSGPSLAGAAEGLGSHTSRLGPLPRGIDSSSLVTELEASGLLGRGGAGFPVGRKWRALAERPTGRAVIVANGAEGEPASLKDRVLMAHRPHLVLDGAILAANAIDADEIVLYIGQEHKAAVESIGRAIDERRGGVRQPIRLVQAPIGYVAGEASAAVNYINTRDARPTTTPPRVSEHGVDGGPTLVQNVESLAYAALIVRFGAHWYRTAGRLESPGTALITVGGAAGEGGVREVELGITVGEIADAEATPPGRIQAVLLGGYFGTWASVRDVRQMPLDPAEMKRRGLTFGCGIVGLLPTGTCGVVATAGIMAYLAKESAGQCGPCVHGLRAIGDATGRLASGQAGASEVVDIERWASQIGGRGACHHPDGAIQLMTSAMNVFGDEFIQHARTGRCSVTGSRIAAA
jgi:NADH:ubiquinone oxidoreductase subunit F (NADH-binding)